MFSVPIHGVISDGQKSIRNAVATALSDIPHQLCHFHYLREAAKPVYEADRHAKKESKKQVRGIRPIEREVERQKNEKGILTRKYYLAARSALTDDGHPPPAAPSLKLYERLSLITASLERVAQKGGCYLPLTNWIVCSKRDEQRRSSYYDMADLPRTNNDLEHVFGSTRYHERRATGRKQASPGLVVCGSVRLVAALATQNSHFSGSDLAPRNLAQWRTRRKQVEHRHEEPGIGWERTGIYLRGETSLQRQRSGFKRSPTVRSRFAMVS